HGLAGDNHGVAATQPVGVADRLDDLAEERHQRLLLVGLYGVGLEVRRHRQSGRFIEAPQRSIGKVGTRDGTDVEFADLVDGSGQLADELLVVKAERQVSGIRAGWGDTQRSSSKEAGGEAKQR